MPNVELRKLNETGRLEVQGPTVGLAYWPAPDVSLQEGVFQTGDIGEIRNQEVYLTGRATDRINVAGRKVAPETVESALLSLPDVERCLAFGIASENRQRGEEVAAVLALKSDLLESEWNWEEMRSILSDKLRPWEMPRKIWITSELRPNERGKLSRVEWRKRFLSRE
jgi:acyl-coenzyme A synthetase/AMP-(fatty) acid ligase